MIVHCEVILVKVPPFFTLLSLTTSYFFVGHSKFSSVLMSLCISLTVTEKEVQQW